MKSNNVSRDDRSRPPSVMVPTLAVPLGQSAAGPVGVGVGVGVGVAVAVGVGVTGAAGAAGGAGTAWLAAEGVLRPTEFSAKTWTL